MPNPAIAPTCRSARRYRHRYQAAGCLWLRIDAADQEGRSRRQDHHVQHERRPGLRGPGDRDGRAGYISKGDDPRLFVKAVRKVVAGEKFISPHLAEAVAFMGAAIKANPSAQMNARELEILRLLGAGTRSSRSPTRSASPTRRSRIRPPCLSRNSAPRTIPISSVSPSRWNSG